MCLHLTPPMLVGAYELLRSTPPFKSWKLPHPDDIGFRVTKTEDRAGQFCDGTIDISTRYVGRLPSLVETMAHEMIHLRQWLLKLPLDHGIMFRDAARVICRLHGFDAKAF